MNGAQEFCGTTAIEGVTRLGDQIVDDQGAQLGIEIPCPGRQLRIACRLQCTPFRLTVQPVQIRVYAINAHYKLRAGLHQEHMVAGSIRQG